MKPSDVQVAIDYVAVQQQRPLFLWGPPGIGKSDIVRSVAAKLKIGLADKRLSQSDPTELKGYPWPDSKTKTMVFFRDGDLPTKGKGILLLDEMNSAPQAVQAAAYQLILDRRLGDYELPAGWCVVAAGNRAGDRSVVHAMPAALANRFVHVDVTPDLDDWKAWAHVNGISAATTGYLSYRPANLYTDKIEPGARAYPTPRSWAFADQILNAGLPPHIEMELLQGTVGEGVAVEYAGFAREQRNLPKIERILVSPETVPIPDSPSTCYALISLIEHHTTPNNLGLLMKYVSRMNTEFQTVYMRTIARRGDEYVETAAYVDWIHANKAVLI